MAGTRLQVWLACARVPSHKVRDKQPRTALRAGHLSFHCSLHAGAQASSSMLHLVLAPLIIWAAAALNPGLVFQEEPVPADTIRIYAIGTGPPNIARKHVATSYLLDLGNEARVLFDVGTGSIANLHAVVPEDKRGTLDTVFLSHLHSDHITDLAPLYALTNGRTRPLTVYGPDGEESETGTAAVINGLRQFLSWDQKSRNHLAEYPEGYTGNQIVAHEFDHTKERQLIYQDSNVTVYSNPAFHYDTPGPVSLRLEWKGLAITYSGDTVPLNTFNKFAEGSDVIIHETVGPVFSFEDEPPEVQRILLNHTTQRELGAILNILKPRLAVATHTRTNSYNSIALLSTIRSTYPHGPLALATDFDVWDVSKSSITQRRFVPVEEHVGYEFNGYPQEHDLANDDIDRLPRPDTVHGGWSVFHIPGDQRNSTARWQ